MELEGPDETITLQRAAAIAGLALHTLSDAARRGRLTATRPGHDWLTTRRDLHRYLGGRSRGVVKPLPPGYQTPRGEVSIAAGRPTPPTVTGVLPEHRERSMHPSPNVGAEAGRLAAALRALPALAPSLIERDIAVLEQAAAILERLSGAAADQPGARTSGVDVEVCDGSSG